MLTKYPTRTVVRLDSEVCVLTHINIATGTDANHNQTQLNPTSPLLFMLGSLMMGRVCWIVSDLLRGEEMDNI
jgi:hypothetical protein